MSPYAVTEDLQVEDTTRYVLAYRHHLLSGGACGLEAEVSAAMSESPDVELFIHPRVSTTVRPFRLLVGETRPAVPTNEQERWNAYMASLAEGTVGLSTMHARAVQSTWWKLWRKVGLPLRHPAAGPGGDLGFQMSWNTDRCYLDIDIAEDGTFEWFFKDRRDGSFAGSDDESLTSPPEELVRLLVRFCLA